MNYGDCQFNDTISIVDHSQIAYFEKLIDMTS